MSSCVLSSVYSGLSPFGIECLSVLSLFYVESHSEFSPFGVESIRGWVPSGLSPFGVQSHSVLSPFGQKTYSRFRCSRFSRWIETGRLDVMPQPLSEVPRLHLKRARDREGGSETAWCTDSWRRELLGRGWWWRGLKESNKPPRRLEYTKTAPKKGSFPHLKIAKNVVFYSKVINKIYFQDIFWGNEF